MAELPRQHELPIEVQQALREVRRGIRRYVWLEGLAAIVVALAIAFWVGLLLDWLFEPTPTVRLAGMVAAAAVALWIAYRFLLRRAFVPLNDSSLALVMERRFPELGEHMLTAVAMADLDAEAANYNPELVARTQDAAARAIEKLDTKALFRRGPLLRMIAAAALLLASIPVFAVSSSEVFRTWMGRI